MTKCNGCGTELVIVALVAFGALYFLLLGSLFLKDALDAIRQPGPPWWGLAMASGACFLIVWMNASVLIAEFIQ